MQGIYYIYSHIDPRIYVGSSKDIFWRFDGKGNSGSHISRLRKGLKFSLKEALQGDRLWHDSPRLQEFVNWVIHEDNEYDYKDPSEFLSIKVVEFPSDISRDVLYSEEQKILDEYNFPSSEWFNNVFNQSPTAKGTHKGNPVFQFDFSGKFIAEYEHSIKAEKLLGIASDSIRKAADFSMGTKYWNVLQAGGFIWSYCNSLSRPLSDYVLYTTVYQFDLKGNLLKSYDNARQAALVNGWSQPKHIHSSCYFSTNSPKYKENKAKTYKGFIWSYEPELHKDLASYIFGNSVYKFSLEGKLLEKYETVAIAQRETGITNISKACQYSSGLDVDRKIAGGFIWSYSDRLNRRLVEYSHKSQKSIYYSLGNYYVKFRNATVAARHLPHSNDTISRYAKGKTKPKDGAVFSYEPLFDRTPKEIIK